MPFTVEQFFEIFGAYHEAVWPAPLVLIGLALVGIVLIIRPSRWSHAAVACILAALWAWLAIAYHFVFFARINPLAYAFAALSIGGASIFFWEGLVRHRLRFEWRGNARAWIGAALVGFALGVYPVWSWLAGHTYPHMPTFGLPCPTTLYTLGMLAFLVPPYPRWPLMVPVIWSAIGAQAAFFLEVGQDLSLIGAGLMGVYLMMRNGRLCHETAKPHGN